MKKNRRKKESSKRIKKEIKQFGKRKARKRKKTIKINKKK